MENGTKRWAIVNDGVVVNIVAADEAFANAQGYVFVSDKDILDPDDAEIWIGWLWDGAKFSPPPRNLEREIRDAEFERDARLVASDPFIANDLWMGYTDAEKQAWADYRNALRNILETYPDPADIVWPEAPNA